MMQSILPDHFSSLEHSLDVTVAERLNTIPKDLILHQWNAQTCEEKSLPWLAWALSVDEWKDEWSEQTKRDVIQSSIDSHSIKGTVGSLKKALHAIGVRLNMQEWREFDGVPHTVRVTAYINEILAEGEELISQSQMLSLLRIVENYSPARTSVELEVGAEFRNSLNLIAGFRNPVCVKSVQMQQERKDSSVDMSLPIQILPVVFRPFAINSAIGVIA